MEVSLFKIRIQTFPGQVEYSMEAQVELMSQTGDNVWNRPPISIDFVINMFAASGNLVKYFRIEEQSKYEAVKWVRYVTKAGTFEVRI